MPSNYDMGKLVQDNAKITKRRSFVPLHHHSQFDMNAGLLYPCCAPWEVLPADTFEVGHGLKIRMTNPPKVPVMDQLVFDLYYFYVPFRIIWNQFDDFITGNTGGDWTIISNLSVPQLTIDDQVTGSLYDYLGIVVPAYTPNVTNPSVSILPIRGYYSIWNWFWRFEPLQNELYFAIGSNNETALMNTYSSNLALYYSNKTNYMTWLRTNAVVSGALAPVNKLDDMYTRALPQPAAAPDIPIMSFDNFQISKFTIGGSSSNQLMFTNNSGYVPAAGESIVTAQNANPYRVKSENATSSQTILSLTGTAFTNGGTVSGIVGNTIRDLRTAFILDSLYTVDARWGRRVNSYTMGHFGCSVPDYRLDQPEFLSHKRVYINVNQVVQSSSSVTNSPQGNVGAWSETADSGFDFLKSFCEYGLIYPLCCIRILNHTYSQGTQRLYKRKTRFDFYLPDLAGLSDTPLANSELMAVSQVGEGIFGYSEPWAPGYKFIQNHVAGHCRPNSSNSIAVWNYADAYITNPALSESWIMEDITPINRTMYMNASMTECQFIVDIYFKIKSYRTMPMYSVVPATLTGRW